MGCVGAHSTVPGTGCGGAIDDSLYSPFFSVASDDRDDDDEDGWAPQTVNEALAHGDASETVEDKGFSGEVSKETIGNKGREAHKNAAKLTSFDSSLHRKDSIGNEGGVPSTVTSTSTNPSPSPISAGSAEGGDADPSKDGRAPDRKCDLSPWGCPRDG